MSVTAIEVKKEPKTNSDFGLNLFIRKGANPEKQICLILSKDYMSQTYSLFTDFPLIIKNCRACQEKKSRFTVK